MVIERVVIKLVDIDLAVIELDFGVGIHQYPSKTLMLCPVVGLYPSPAS